MHALFVQLARDWSRLVAEQPNGFSSQRQIFKALAAIARTQENRRPKAIGGKGAARCANDGGKGAARCANDDSRGRTGPSRPFVEEALQLVRSIDETLDSLVSRGFPLDTEAGKIRATLERLRTMLDREIDEASAAAR